VEGFFVVLFFSLLGWGCCFFFKVLWGGFVIIESIPGGVPLFLMFPILFIELVSSLIQPFTLRIRLVANIIAGHILISVVSGVLRLLFIFVILELGVAVIQAGVYTMLLILYN